MPSTPNTIQTERLLLRPIEVTDEVELHRLWTDPDVRRYLWDDQIISRETVADIIASSRQCFAQYGLGFYALEQLSAANRLVGFCGVREFEEQEQLELLYGMFPEFWGGGIITEAAQAVLRHGFENCAIPRVVAATDTPNQPSVRVMQRLGMVFQCRREWHGLDTVFYELDTDAFQRL